jgi:Uma2 family endonuclease
MISSTTPPPGIPPWPVARLSVAGYEKLVASGALGPEEKTELIRGWVVPKMTMNPPHNHAVNALTEMLCAMLGSIATVRVQMSIRLPDSIPEPDLAICQGPRTRYRDRHPTSADVLFLVEVADTSLHYDLGDKLRLYAENGVAEYWVVNLPAGRIEVYTQPSGMAYLQRQEYFAGDAVPVAVGGMTLGTVPVAEVLG